MTTSYDRQLITERARLLQRIAWATGRPVKDFYNGAAREAADQRDALLRAWDAIETEDARRRALAAVLTIADENRRADRLP